MTNLIISDSAFYKNEGTKSGAVHIRSYTNSTITSTKFKENKSESYGAVTVTEVNSTMHLNECDTQSNEAKSGGGVFYIASYGEFYCENSTLIDDYAPYGCIGYVDSGSNQKYEIESSLVEPADNCNYVVYVLRGGGQSGEYNYLPN